MPSPMRVRVLYQSQAVHSFPNTQNAHRIRFPPSERLRGLARAPQPGWTKMIRASPGLIVVRRAMHSQIQNQAGSRLAAAGPAWLSGPLPVLALAPMQDVTDRAFWNLIAAYGGADLYFTEYFRVHRDSHLEKTILDSLIHNPTGRPAIAQMIGNDIPALIRAARELQNYPIAAIDLNLGCPAPVVYRKGAGGGLLRDVQRVDAILGALREAITIPFTVKTRIGFDDPAVFDQMLPIFARHSLDLLTVHGRTVSEMYRGEVHYDTIAKAVQAMPCPVLANGNIDSHRKAREVLSLTGARGLMIGRGAIRNPWMFAQIRQGLGNQAVFVPTGHDVMEYVQALYEAVETFGLSEISHVQNMKKYLNFIGIGVEPSGDFLHRIRRVTTRAGFFKTCEDHLNHPEPMLLEPFPVKRQNP